MTRLTEAYDYERVRLFGKLICTSDLHVGTGDPELFEERFAPNNSEKVRGGYNSICLDARGRPYLPGSTLRGFGRLKSFRTKPYAKGRLVAWPIASGLTRRPRR